MGALLHLARALAMPRGTVLRSLSLAGLAFATVGCGVRGMTIEDIAADPSIITGSVNGAAARDATETSDAVTIRNVVTSLDLESGAAQGLAWANAETGSRGAVRSISEYRENGTLCRRFEATRESFDGVALYQGESCLAAQGIWAMTAFDRL